MWITSRKRQVVSSPPPEASAEPRPRPLWLSYWPTWRRLMLAGALVLLAGALLVLVFSERSVPDPITIGARVVGYVLLAWGFVLKLLEKRSRSG